MTTSIVNATFDGATDVNIFGNIWEWFIDNGLGYRGAFDLRFDDGNPATTEYELNLTLEGNFRTNAFTTRSDGTPINLNVTDVNDGGQRDIYYFRAASSGGAVNALIEYTNIDYFVAYNDSDVNLTLGEIEINNVRLDDGMDVVELQGFDSEIDTLETRSAKDEVILSGDESRVRLLSMGDGVDKLRLTGFDALVESADMGSGNDKVYLVGDETRIDMIQLGDGNDLVELTGQNARIYLMHFGEGNDSLTVGENTQVGSVESWEGSKTVTIANGGSIDQLEVDSENTDVNTIAVDAGAYLSSFRGRDGDDHLTVLGGAEQISLGRGTNTLVTGTEWIGTVLSISGDNTVTVNGGQIQSIGFSGGVDEVEVLGGGGVQSVELGSNDDFLYVKDGSWVSTANLGSGDSNTAEVSGENSQIVALIAYSGDDTVRLKAGGDSSVDYRKNEIANMDLGSGENKVYLNANTWVGSLRTGGDQDKIWLYSGNTEDSGARLQQAATGGGDDVIRVNGYARVDSLQTADGNDKIILNDDGRILLLKMGAGNDTLTTSEGNVESVYDYSGNTTLEIGSGGLQQARLGDQSGSHTVTTSGWIDSLSTNGTTEVTFNGPNAGATQMNLGDGDDTITANDARIGEIRTDDGEDMVHLGTDDVDFLHTGGDNDVVTTGDGYVFAIRLGDGDDLIQQGSGGGDIIRAGDGNDTVELGTGGVGMARLGGGDDVIRLMEIDPDDGVVVQAGGGTDQADFSAFSAGITLDLREYDYQNVVPGPGDTSIAGYFSFASVENLTGTDFDDILRGNYKDNVLRGDKGNDKIWGYEGADTIIGGAGKDTMFGGDGPDTFYFKSGHGTKDRIKDFDVTEDIIDFKTATSLADISITQVGSDVWVESLTDNVRVRVENVTVAQMSTDEVFGF